MMGQSHPLRTSQLSQGTTPTLHLKVIDPILILAHFVRYITSLVSHYLHPSTGSQR